MKYQNKIHKLLVLLSKLSIRTFYFNFKYLPFKHAIKLPIFLSRKVYLKHTEGKIILDFTPRIGQIQIGFGNLGIFDDIKSRTILNILGTIIFKGKAEIGHGSKISVGTNGVLILGDNFKISAESTIVADHRIEFGKNCLLSWDNLIMDTDFHPIKDMNGKLLNANKPIIFGDNIWIGCRCSIFKGSVVPDNCVIGSNSRISRPLLISNSLYGGSPIQCIKENIIWENTPVD